MTRLLSTFIRVLSVVLVMASPALGQGGATASIVGTVLDASGAVLPGADVVAVNNATRGEFRTVSSDQGSFTIPAVNAGTYTVTVSLMGFKTATINDIVVNAGVPAAVKAALEVGTLAETVVVSAGAELLQTQTAAVATTLDIRQVTNLPLAN